jgi:cytochrome P450
MTKDLLGNGIFAIDGEEWQKQRKTTSNIFTVSNFRDFFISVFNSELLKLIDHLQQHEEVDLHDLFHKYTLDSFMKIGFSYDLNSLTKPSKFADSFTRAQVSCISFRNNIQIIINKRFFNGIWPLTQLVDGSYFQLMKDMQIINDFIDEIIAAHSSESSDLLSLLKHKYEGIELREIVLNLIIAGRDTTAQALSWTFLELMQRPEIVEKIRAEFDGIPTYDEIKTLVFA